MARRSSSLRFILLLVAAWYAGIASGQMSLAETFATEVQAATGQQSAAMPSMAMLMPGMDCPQTSLPNSPKHICTCIDLGCHQLDVALPANPVVQHRSVDIPVEVGPPSQPLVVWRVYDYRVPPSTAPPLSV